MAKDIRIFPTQSNANWLNDTDLKGRINLDANDNFVIYASASLVLGDTAADVYIGDGTNYVDIIFEQDGDVRTVAGKTLTLGQTGSIVKVNSEKFYMQSGAFGIGVSSPTGSFHIRTTTSPLIVLEDTGSGTDVDIRFIPSTPANTFTLGIDDSDSDKFKLSYSTLLGTNDRISIDTSGNVGIGTTSTAAGARVHIAGGDLYMDGTTSVNFSGSALSNLLEINGVGILRQTTLNGGLSLGRDDSLILGAGESVALMDAGVSTADEVVYIGGEQGVKLYGFPNNNSLAFANRVAAELQTGTLSGGNFKFYTGSTELHRISLDNGGNSWFNNGGNIGIGTTSPANTLQVQGNVSASSYTSSINNAIGFLGTASRAVTASFALNGGSGPGTVNSIALFDTTTTISSSNIFQSGSNIGIGTSTPQSSLEVSSATGTATPTPTEIRISTTNNASDWSTTSPWGRLSFYSADISSTGPSIHAALDTITTATTGGTSVLSFKVKDSTTQLNEHMRITDSKILIGTSQSLSVGGGSRQVQIQGTTGDIGMSIVRNTTIVGSGGTLALGRSRGTVVNDVTAVTDEDFLGAVNFAGADGTGLNDYSARIVGVATGSISTGIVPGYIRFDVKNLAGTQAERMRLTADGALEIRNSNNGLTDGSANNVLRFVDTDTTTAQGQGVGAIQFYSSDATAPGPGVKAAIRGVAPGASGGGELMFDVSPNGGPTFEAAELYSNSTTASIFEVKTPTTTAVTAVYFSDSANTGRGKVVYDHSVDSLYFDALSSTVMYISGSGNVGIGTTNPQGRLHVVSSALPNAHYNDQKGIFFQAEESQIQILSDDGGNHAGKLAFTNVPASGDNKHWMIDHKGPGLNNRFDISYFTTSASGNILAPSGAEKVSITTGGSVGIGSTIPQTKLDVNGEIAIGGAAFLTSSAAYNIIRRRDGGVGIYLGGSDTNNYYDNSGHYFRDRSSTTRMYIAASTTGNVGIGTTNPSNKLQIEGNVSASSYTSSLSNAVGYFGTSSRAVSASRADSSATVDVLSGGATTGLGVYSGSFSGSFFGNLSGGSGAGFPYAGDAVITGSLLISGSGLRITGSTTTSGSILPAVDNLFNLGSSTNRWANLYTGDLNLSNEGSMGNIVDGTTGNWTIQEGEEYLYIINKKSGKRYRFMLEEVE